MTASRIVRRSRPRTVGWRLVWVAALLVGGCAAGGDASSVNVHVNGRYTAVGGLVVSH